MLKWLVRRLLNLCGIAGVIALLIYAVNLTGELNEQTNNTHMIHPAPAVTADNRQDDEMTDYMYNVWLPVTTVVIMQ